jgi:hypothetical protein
MELKKINFLELRNLFRRIRKDSKKAIGNYLYKSFRIQVSRYNLSVNERVMQLYKRRRENGECILCGKKVKRINPKTGRLYRLCDYHRNKIDKNLKK